MGGSVGVASIVVTVPEPQGSSGVSLVSAESTPCDSRILLYYAERNTETTRRAREHCRSVKVASFGVAWRGNALGGWWVLIAATV